MSSSKSSALRVALRIAVLVALLAEAHAARILGLFPYPGYSHHIMYERLMVELASRGHSVVVYSHFPQQTPVPNLTDVSLVGLLPSIVNSQPFVPSLGTNDIFGDISCLRDHSLEVCEKTLASPIVQRLIQSNETFDLIFTEAFNSDCMLPFVHKFRAPNIAMYSATMMPWTDARFGNPNNPSYIGNQFVPAVYNMNFWQRLRNTFFTVYLTLYYHWFIQLPTHAIAVKHFGETLPPLDEIAGNTSLLLVNTSPVLNFPRPMVPAVVEVAGMHLKPANKLPEDIQEFMDGAEHGVIYFSFGSTVRSETLPEDKRKAFLEAFSQLPQRVLWKWESGSLMGKPDNLKVAAWLPQSDILCHPKTLVFMTHGGLMGTTEALHCGVPLLVTPLFGDQDRNAAAYIDKGVALPLPYHDISKQLILRQLGRLIGEEGFRSRAAALSALLRDSPAPPLQKAVWWSEYVLRHRGAPHLRCAAARLPLLSHLLLDVLLAATAAAWLLSRLAAAALRLAFARHKQKSA